MLIDRLCSPALIYLAFSIIQLILDMSHGKYRLAIAKLFISLLFTYLLNILCEQRLTQISWIIISLPFLFMGYMSLLLVYALGFSDANGNDISEEIDGSEEPQETEETEETEETDETENTETKNIENSINNIFAFESFAMKSKLPTIKSRTKSVEPAHKKASNLNLDALKLENGKI